MYNMEIPAIMICLVTSTSETMNCLLFQILLILHYCSSPPHTTIRDSFCRNRKKKLLFLIDLHVQWSRKEKQLFSTCRCSRRRCRAAEKLTQEQEI